ncbi:FMN-binding protein [bacterium]|nr:FMN-binding protein [bacterium]
MRSWLRQSWLVLVLAGSLGTALAVIEQSLEGRIAEHASKRLSVAVLSVVPGGVRSEEKSEAERREFAVFDEQGSLCGRAFVAETTGFGDRIRLMVGVTADGTELLGVAVLESRETPGLGERIRETAFLKQFSGRSTAIGLQVVRPGQTARQPVDVISGATISSKAVTRAVNECIADMLGQRAEVPSPDGLAGGEQ